MNNSYLLHIHDRVTIVETGRPGLIIGEWLGVDGIKRFHVRYYDLTAYKIEQWFTDDELTLAVPPSSSLSPEPPKTIATPA